MADVMTAPAVAGRLAVRERLGRGRQTGIDAEVVQQAVGTESEQIIEGLVAHADQLRIENPDILERERNGGQGGKRVPALRGSGRQIRRVTRKGRGSIQRRLNHFSGRSTGGKRRAGREYAAEKVASDHRSILSGKHKEPGRFRPPAEYTSLGATVAGPSALAWFAAEARKPAAGKVIACIASYDLSSRTCKRLLLTELETQRSREASMTKKTKLTRREFVGRAVS